MNHYEPFGKEWEKEVMSIPITGLEMMFDIKKNKGESKKDFVQRLKEELKTRNN